MASRSSGVFWCRRSAPDGFSRLSLILPLIQKLTGSQYGYPAERMQYQQVFVVTNDAGGVPLNGQFQKPVIFRVATCRDVLRYVHKGRFANQGSNKLATRNYLRQGLKAQWP